MNILIIHEEREWARWAPSGGSQRAVEFGKGAIRIKLRLRIRLRPRLRMRLRPKLSLSLGLNLN
jgi:hypothetical protein